MKKTFFALALLFSMTLISSFHAPSVSAQVTGDPACVRSGCSNELCVPFGTSINTTCVYRPEYACYQQAACELNSAGQCAFTITAQVQACLDESEDRPSPSPSPSPSATPTVSPSPSPSASPSVSPSVSPSPAVLIGDLNNDGKVNLVDYSILIFQLFDEGPNLEADINQDGKVNLVDYSILIFNLST